MVLARCADAVRPEPRELPDATTHEVAALVERQRQLGALHTAEANRLQVMRVDAVRRQIRAQLDWLERQRHDLDEALAQAVEHRPLWRYGQAYRGRGTEASGAHASPPRWNE